MKMSGSTRRLREDFEAQFEPSGNGRYLYRRSQRGEPIPVSQQERDAFIHQYLRRVRFILVGMAVALVAFMAAEVAWSVSTNNDDSELRTIAGSLLIAVAAIGAIYWARAAPSRELGGRSSVGRERSKEEMRAIFFKKVRYGKLAAAGVGGVVLVAGQAAKSDIFSGWHRIWLVIGASLVILAAIQAFRKWMFENA